MDEVLASRPHLVTLEFAINDADLRDGVSLRRSIETHRAILSRLRPGAGVLLMTMNPATGPRGWIRPRLDTYYEAYRPLAEEADAGLLDLYPRWLARPAGGPGGDGLHPDAGAAAAMIVAPLVAIAGAALGRRCAA